ncbi:membrane protein [Gillisia sp. Hel1_33_143]|uniref:YihY/virulence factor BrkB family protein n=1 Tax=unclassified Gillisia TaxID=2615025 RepID=UPI00055923BF|nr:MULTISPECIES: YihY/virulence factor BrkB family protein [unclassified Gillisia]SDS51854.1 membrane protein [Gillisia sp. Hel1_33_143]
MKRLKTFLNLLKKSYTSWMDNEPFQKSAIIAYYTLFSLPSLLIIVVTIAGYFFGKEAVQGRITGQISRFIGEGAAEAIENMISSAALDNNSTLTVVFGVAMLIFGATGVFFQLKIAMNNIWNVAEKKATFFRMVIDRMISFGMILVIGFLLLMALIVSASISYLSDFIGSSAQIASVSVIQLINYVISFMFITTLFAFIFQLLPDVKIKWRITLKGAGLTTILFLIGESLIGFYFGNTDPGSVYGGASSIVLILLWVNYTCLIMFFGAEFTVQYALYKNEKISPNEFSEPAIHQEMEKLEEKKQKLKADHKTMECLENNTESEEVVAK